MKVTLDSRVNVYNLYNNLDLIKNSFYVKLKD